jgi:hypothetical protein
MTKEEALKKIKELEAYIEEQEAKEVTLEEIEDEVPDKQYALGCDGATEHALNLPLLKTGFTSKESAEQLQALGELIRVRDYIEGGRIESFHEDSNTLIGIISELPTNKDNYVVGLVKFSSKENAKRALNILGEDRIRKAYGYFRYS